MTCFILHFLLFLFPGATNFTNVASTIVPVLLLTAGPNHPATPSHSSVPSQEEEEEEESEDKQEEEECAATDSAPSLTGTLSAPSRLLLFLPTERQASWEWPKLFKL